jgi:phage terminase Nu1 subunit (DNA packaging protein)
MEIITLSLSTAAGAASGGILDSLSLDIKRKFPELNTQMIEAFRTQCVKAQNEISRMDAVVMGKLRDYLKQQDS